MTTPGERPACPHSSWWEAPGSLRTRLLGLDSQVEAIVNAERHVVDPVVVFGEVARQLDRIAQQMGLGAGDRVVKQSGRVLVFEPVKPYFTRKTGSIRQLVRGR